jgi:phospholipid/cholesterol/gamma-HCH transport system substrate-binding protein
MNISNELRVGIMFLSGLILLVLTIVSLTRWGQGRNSYTFRIHFKHAQGLQTGAPVHVAGVEVGRVTLIELDPITNEPLVTVRVGRDVTVYDNYHFTIGMTGIVGEHFVEVVPVAESAATRGTPIQPGHRVEGYTVPDLNDILAQASTLAGKLTQTVDTLNGSMLSPETMQNMQQTMANLRKTSENAMAFSGALTQTLAQNQDTVSTVMADVAGVASDMRRLSHTLLPQLANTKSLRNIELAAEQAAGITKRLDHMAAVLETTVTDKELLAGVKDSVTRMKGVTAQIEGLVGDARGALKSAPEIAANLKQFSADLPTIVKPFKEVATNLQQVTADLPTIMKPFKEIAPQTAADVAQITKTLRAVSDDLSGLTHRFSNTGKAVGTTKLDTEARVMGGVGPGKTGNSNFRSDLNFDVRIRDSMLRAGVADVGQGNTLNLQYGNRLGKDLWLRYGVLQSQAGVGLDYRLNPDLRLSGELFDPNDLGFNAVAEYRLRPLGNAWWLTGGAYNVFSNPSVAAGVTYRP